jgi:3-phenylpropionate/cinnamic acid dioxygenase small subunit
MRRTYALAALSALLATALLVHRPALAGQAGPHCDQACLTALLGQYEARLRRLEDEQAIEHLLLEYGRTLDARDFAAYAALFAAEGEWKGAMGTYKGPRQIQTEMERIFASATDIPKGQNFHAMSNFRISVQGDRATATSNFVFYTMEGNKPVASVAGRYEDELVRVAGTWKFLRRTALPPG